MVSLKSKRGFTLLEIMISISIVALILTSLFRMQSGTIKLATIDKFNSMTPALAQQLLARMERDLINWSENEGDFGETFPGIKWTCEISDSFFEEIDFISEENARQFKKIEIEITDASGQRAYKIATWRFAIE